MRLQRLSINRLPGIQPGFTLDRLSSGVNVIVGPNASGKTSVLRAIRALLYAGEQRDLTVDAEGVFEDQRGQLTATRVANDIRWSLMGQAVDAPELPDHRFLSCYMLELDDLLHPGSTDAEIAQRIAMDLAGGYDIQAVLDEFSVRTNHGRAEARRLSEANMALRKREDECRLLAEKESGLDELRNGKLAAEEASREAARYDSALTLLRARRQRQAIDRQLTEFPERMDRLQGNELEKLQEIRKRQTDYVVRRTTARHGLRSAGATIRGAGLSGSHLERAAMGQHRIKAGRLRDLEIRCEQLGGDVRRAQTARALAAEALGGISPPAIRLDPAVISEVESRLADKRTLEAEIRVLQADAARLPDDPGIDETIDRLRTARSELLAWLAAPARRPPLTTFGLGVSAAIVAAVIVIAGARVHPACLLSLIPLAAALYALLRPVGASRRGVRERFSRTEVVGPGEWEEAGVRECLYRLDRQLLEAGRVAAGSQRRRDVIGELTAKQKTLDRELELLDRLAEEVGFHPGVLDASLERWVRLVSEYGDTHQELETAGKERDHCTAAAAKLRSGLVGFLAEHGETSDAQEPDAVTLLALLERLDSRLAQSEQGRRDMAAAITDIRSCAGEIQRCNSEIEALFDASGLQPGQGEAELRQRLSRLGEWRKRCTEFQRAQGVELQWAGNLADRSDLCELVKAGDESALCRVVAELTGRAEQRDDLVRQIAQIEQRLDTAQRARLLEAARAERQSAEDALKDRLDSALFAQAGRFLLQQVEAEYVAASRPAVLRQAEEWFGRFTRHQCGLIFDRDGTGGFAAYEHASGTRRALAELSGGTRAQLLIAVRMAFAAEAERGRTSLPLFLDETLATSDRERFEAVADSIRLIADTGGRQVFYFTTRPQDAQVWLGDGGDDSVCLIDLSWVRKRVAVADPGRLTIQPRRQVPSPDGCSAEEYGVIIGVDAVDPWADASAIHVFHLFRDDPKFVHWLLDQGIDRLGPLISLLRSKDPAISCDMRLRALARTAGAEAWVEAWREGRGRPVDRWLIQDSGVVSAGFMEAVLALVEQVRGDAAQLLDRMRNGAVARFRSERLERLEQWLRCQGCLDQRRMLDWSELQLRVRAAMAAVMPDPGADARFIADSLSTAVTAGL